MPIGRPKEFDEIEALGKAMEVFWTKGYEATKVEDLVNGMGINRQSIYDTFGDKHTLFVASIAHYRERIPHEILTILNAPGSPLANIRNALAHAAALVEHGKCRGCLITNTAIELSPHEPAVAEVVKSILGDIESAFRRALQRAVQKKEIARHSNTLALARFFTSTLQGMFVMSKVSSSPVALKDIVKTALRVLDK